MHISQALAFIVVPKRGFEPLHPFEYCPLKTACLPIPPLRHKIYGVVLPVSAGAVWVVPSVGVVSGKVKG